MPGKSSQDMCIFINKQVYILTCETSVKVIIKIFELWQIGQLKKEDRFGIKDK